jgi:hypothetical protein
VADYAFAHPPYDANAVHGRRVGDAGGELTRAALSDPDAQPSTPE